MTINSNRFSALNNAHTEFREHQLRDAARPLSRIDHDQLKVFLERDIGILLPVQALRQKYLSGMQDLTSVNEAMAAAAKAYYVASQLTSKAFIESYFPTTTGMGEGAVMVELVDFNVQVKIFVERLIPISYDEKTDEIAVYVRGVSRPRDCPASFYEFNVLIGPSGWWRGVSMTKHHNGFDSNTYSALPGLSLASEPSMSY